MEITIRKERLADYQAVFEIVELAFRTMPFADGDEQFLVEELRKEGHRIAKTLGFTSCFVLGHPDYYPRFGYKPAGGLGIPPPHGAPPEAFMAVEFVPGSLTGVSGTAKFLPEFGV